MSNMGHCRFENTYKDLCDCYEHIDDDDLSPHEMKYKKRLVELCQDIASMFEGEVDYE